ncbi:Uncharacterized protein dnm_050720 [Desulfonema magnum]|uniref:Uncharacterized protein n=1 Tax=Desulfonema magnum TaxID=45655 RepID=A0A975GPP5_9BACT|nr:Uncharacterized protein dnm_050720 [Desulfonema magnum]
MTEKNRVSLPETMDSCFRRNDKNRVSLSYFVESRPLITVSEKDCPECPKKEVQNMLDDNKNSVTNKENDDDNTELVSHMIRKYDESKDYTWGV